MLLCSLGMNQNLPKLHSGLYALVKPLVKLGGRLFFSQIEIRNLQRMPLNKPVILVSNHQNAMLDPLLLCMFSPKQLHWLTRSDIFRKPSVNKLLRSLNMLPVYRDRDRVADIVEKNKSTFEECFNRLKHEAVVGIFPEGTHRGKKQLVPLKKGLARMVIGAMEAGVEDLVIQPVGLDYENYYDYRKKLVVNFGSPIYAKDLVRSNGNIGSQLLTDVTASVANNLISQMIHIKNDDVYHEIMALQPLTAKVSPVCQPGVEFDTFKTWSDMLDRKTEWHPWLNHEVGQYKRLMHDLRINENSYRERFSRMNLIALIVGLPFVIIAFFIFYPIYLLAEHVVRTVVRDPLFKNSIRLVLWTFVTPVILVLFFFLMNILTCNWIASVAALITVLISGIITLHWLEVRKLFLHHRKCEHLRKNGNASFAEWKTLRKNIIHKLVSLKSSS